MNGESFIFLADGFEEIEALTAVDVMRRAEMSVKTVSITDCLEVKGAHGITVKADIRFADADYSKVNWLVIPGGMPGASNLHNFEPLNTLLKQHFMSNGKIAAICAAPAVVLAPLGIIDGKNATCYPGFEDMMGKSKVNQEYVVHDGNVITACGPAAAMPFALDIVNTEKGEDASYEVGSGMLVKDQFRPFYF